MGSCSLSCAVHALFWGMAVGSTGYGLPRLQDGLALVCGDRVLRVKLVTAFAVGPAALCLVSEQDRETGVDLAYVLLRLAVAHSLPEEMRRVLGNGRKRAILPFDDGRLSWSRAP